MRSLSAAQAIRSAGDAGSTVSASVSLGVSQPPADAGELNPAALYRRFKPLFRPRPVIYWSDMLASALVGWSAFALFLASDPMSIVGVLSLALAVGGLYRAVLFIHEIAHLKHGSIYGFETAWNLLVGIPLFVPSLMYAGTHADHHRRSQFGTEEDPEYESIAMWDPVRICVSFVTMTAVPAILVLRWAVLAPLSYLHPKLRKFVVGHASTLVINPTYRRRALHGTEPRDWAIQEGLAAAWIWGIVYAAFSGIIPPDWLLRLYAVPALILVINHARTLAAHHYVNDDGLPVDRVGQLLDSINLTGGSPLTLLAAPVGLRFHALHHLLPALPYHSLGRVHRTLEQELPPDSPYHATARRGIFSGIGELLVESKRNAARLRRQPSYTTRAR